MGRPLANADAVFYGKFVLAAYTMFDRDPTNLRPEPQAGDIPDPYEFVAWIHMSDFIFERTEPRFYGFVARDKNTQNDFILAIRGTEGGVEWWDDASAYMVPFAQVPHAGRVAHGFDRIYSTLKVVQHPGTAGELLKALPSLELELQGSFAEQLEQLHVRLERVTAKKAMMLEKKGRPKRPYIVTGHSLGAALCTLFVMENKEKDKFDISTLCTFASPRVGNMMFVRIFNLLPIASWRIANTCDLVPKLPLHIPLILDYEHVNAAYEFSSAGAAKDNPVCWHSMYTYLHWLDANIKVLPQCQL
jgi:Lipase (class 3)